MRISLNSSDSVKSPGWTKVNVVFFTLIYYMCGHVHMSQHPKKIREQRGWGLVVSFYPVGSGD